MARSQLLISSGVGARPSPYVGDCAPAIACKTAPSAAISAHRILYAPIGHNPPALDGVEVVTPVRAARFHQVVEHGLHITAFVGATGLEDHFAPVPLPPQAKTRKSDGQHWGLQRSVLQAAAAIHGDFDPANRAASGPCESGDFVKTGTLQFLSA